MITLATAPGSSNGSSGHKFYDMTMTKKKFKKSIIALWLKPSSHRSPITKHHSGSDQVGYSS